MVKDGKFVPRLREGRLHKTVGELRILTLIKLYEVRKLY
jgi:hypothetical protein